MLAAGGCLLGLAAQTSQAITYSVDSGNSGLSGTTSPYGSVMVTLGVDGAQSGAWITFQAANNSSFQYLFGDGGSVGVNVSGSFSFVASSLSWSGQPQSGATAPSYSASSGNEDGLGNFNFSLDNVDGFSHSVEQISFFLSGTWASDSSVLAYNNKGYLTEAHIFVANATTGTDTGIGGFAGTDSQGDPQVPDGGSTVMLLGSTLAGFGMLRRRVGKN